MNGNQGQPNIPISSVKCEVDDHANDTKEDANSWTLNFYETPSSSEPHPSQRVPTETEFDGLLEILKENRREMSFDEYKSLMNGSLSNLELEQMSYDALTSQHLDSKHAATTAIILFKLSQITRNNCSTKLTTKRPSPDTERADQPPSKRKAEGQAKRDYTANLHDDFQLELVEIAKEDCWLVAKPPFRHVNVMAALVSVVSARQNSERTVISELNQIIRHIYAQYVPPEYNIKLAFTPNKMSTGMEQFPKHLADKLMRIIEMCCKRKEPQPYSEQDEILDRNLIYQGVHKRLYEVSLTGPGRTKHPLWFPMSQSDYVASLWIIGAQPLSLQNEEHRELLAPQTLPITLP